MNRKLRLVDDTQDFDDELNRDFTFALETMCSGDEAKAEELFRSIHIRRPGSATIAMFLGRILFHLDRFDEAKTLLSFAASKFPSWHVPWLSLGRISMHEQDYEKARELLGRAVQLDPSENSATQLIEFLIAFDEYKSASDVLNEAIQKYGSSKALEELAAEIADEGTSGGLVTA